jgi:hypothetical protein
MDSAKPRPPRSRELERDRERCFLWEREDLWRRDEVRPERTEAPSFQSRKPIFWVERVKWIGGLLVVRLKYWW